MIMKSKKNRNNKQAAVPVTTSSDTFKIYTDGSYRPEGNAALAYLIFSEKKKEVVKMERSAHRGSTINAMELGAIDHALDYPGMDHVIIYSDSAYSIFCLTLWYKSWQRNNWMTPQLQPVKNKELIQRILSKMATKKSVQFVKVKAHTGDLMNSAVDYLAANLTYLMRDDPLIKDGPYPCP
jgi:ribonuclease HI